MSGVPRDPWLQLASLTPARIGLGRAGASVPTREVLAFAVAHAQARDAVHARLDVAALAAAFGPARGGAISVRSQTTSREHYLTRPDLGRRLDETSHAPLLALADNLAADIALVVGDGLSATAVMAHAPPLVAALRPLVERDGLVLSPPIIAEGARVALGDEIATVLHATAVLVLIGERPGLSSPDSLGAYLTYGPFGPDFRPGWRTDADRNCLSNIRSDGLAPSIAAQRLAWLIDQMFERRLTGVALKDESEQGIVAPREPQSRIGSAG